MKMWSLFKKDKEAFPFITSLSQLVMVFFCLFAIESCAPLGTENPSMDAGSHRHQGPAADLANGTQLANPTSPACAQACILT